MDYKVEIGDLSEKVKGDVASSVALTAGVNTVVYTGDGQTASIAMESIWDYIIISYYLSEGIWKIVKEDTFLQTGMLVSIKVNQDCVLEGDWALKVANLYGFVHDSEDNALPAVSVTLFDYTTATMLDGTFNFTDKPIGTYTITCTKAGYKEFKELITLTEGDNEIDITMEGKVGGIWEWIKGHWQWIAGGAGVAGAIGIGITVVAKRR